MRLNELKSLIQNNDPSLPRLYSELEQFFLKESNPYLESQFANILAYAKILDQNYVESYELALEARQLAERSLNREALAESHRLEGLILDLAGEYGAALEALNQSYKIYNDLVSPKSLLVFSSMGNVYKSLNDFEGLLELSHRFSLLAQKYGDKQAEGTAYFYRGNAQIALERYRDAAINLLLAEKLYKEVQYSFIGNLYLAFAKLYIKEGRLNEALKSISKSIEADNRIGFLYNEGERIDLLSRIYQEQGNHQLAISELQDGLKVDSVQNDILLVLKILNRLIELAELTNNLSMEAQYLKQYNEVFKKSFNEQQGRLIAINTVRQSVFEKEEKIKLLQKENELQVQRNLIQEQNNQYQLTLILVVFGTLLVVSGLLFRTGRQSRQLKTYSEELKKATEAKSDFLARMSHEIRTPINAISGLTKLMQRKVQDTEDLTNLQQIEDASQTLLGVINDILDFSKIEAGKLEIETTEFQLDKVVSQSIRLQSLKAHQKNIELIQHIARDVPLSLKGDGLRIQQILVNLLSNAVKFTEDGLVSVSVKKKYAEHGVLLEFAVKDTGIGLTQKQIEGLFQSFSQVDETISRKYGGTGLGLAICKQLAELMGGEIWVESKLDEGSTFHFTVHLEEDKTQKRVSPSAQLSSLRVLVADDVSLSRQAISEALSQVNITCDVAEGGQDALSKLRQAAAKNAPYNILILDWKMPDIDGLQVAAIINQEMHAHKPKIVMLSAFDFSQIREQARHLGIKHFIEKPFSASELLNKLQELAFNIKPDVSTTLSKLKNAPDLRGKRILLAEDNKLNTKVAKGFLKDTHADVHWAENGKKVLEMVQFGPDYDCILMDVQMPEMDGLTAAQKIRDELNVAVPIIAMTAHAMKQDIEKSAAVGMVAHITKPIDPEYLYQVLTEVLFADSQVLVKRARIENEKAAKAKNDNPLEDLLHMDQQKAMKDLYVDEEYFHSMLGDFVAMKPTIYTLGRLIEHHKYDAIYKVIHDSVSTLTYIGAYNLAKMARAIETILDRKEQATTEGFTEQLNLYNQAMVALVEKVAKQLAQD
ncbi:MAG: response regulator [Aestuariibacter sp.]